MSLILLLLIALCLSAIKETDILLRAGMLYLFSSGAILLISRRLGVTSYGYFFLYYHQDYQI